MDTKCKFKKIKKGSIISNLHTFFLPPSLSRIRALIEYYLFKIWIFKNDYSKKRKSIQKIKKVIFLVQAPLRKAATTKLNGLQICNGMKEKGIPAEIHLKKLPDNLKNSIIIFVKCFPFSEAIKANKKNCIMIYDAIDTLKPFRMEIVGTLCDAIIFPSKKSQKEYQTYLSKNTKSTVIYLHWDNDINRTKRKKQNKKFSLAFFGSDPENHALFYKKIPGLVPLTKFSDQIKRISEFNCLYALRKKNSAAFLYKPPSKVITAAGMDYNIITSKDCAAMELLGEDYPYLTESDLDSVLKTIDYAKKTFGKRVWKNALKTMKKIKEKTSINAIVNEYFLLINSFLIKQPL